MSATICDENNRCLLRSLFLKLILIISHIHEIYIFICTTVNTHMFIIDKCNVACHCSFIMLQLGVLAGQSWEHRIQQINTYKQIPTVKVWGTNYFSLFVSYRFTSKKTQLSEFPESKSDMPLFHWVLALK